MGTSAGEAASREGVKSSRRGGVRGGGGGGGDHKGGGCGGGNSGGGGAEAGVAAAEAEAEADARVRVAAAAAAAAKGAPSAQLLRSDFTVLAKEMRAVFGAKGPMPKRNEVTPHPPQTLHTQP